MAVRDYMTRKVVYVSPDTTIAHAADIMRDQDLRRLPVIEHDQLVGLVTEGTIAEASPSKATSLSIYEMNYLLNKTTVGEVMIKDVITISSDASLEDAIYLMIKHSIGVLPVSDNGVLVGIITDKDVFRAFLDISAYGEEGIRINILADDEVGVLGKLVSFIADQGLNIKRTVQAKRKNGKVDIEIQVDSDGDVASLKSLIENAGFLVDSIQKTEAKVGF